MKYERTYEELLLIVRHLDADAYDYIKRCEDGDEGDFGKDGFISGLFSWSETPQGTEYWIDLENQHLQWMRDEKPVPKLQPVIPDELFNM